MGDQFDFKKHQSFRKSRKMVIRFIIYSVVIFLLLYLIMREEKQAVNKEMVDEIELDTTNIDE